MGSVMDVQRNLSRFTQAVCEAKRADDVYQLTPQLDRRVERTYFRLIRSLCGIDRTTGFLLNMLADHVATAWLTYSFDIGDIPNKLRHMQQIVTKAVLDDWASGLHESRYMDHFGYGAPVENKYSRWRAKRGR